MKLYDPTTVRLTPKIKLHYVLLFCILILSLSIMYLFSGCGERSSAITSTSTSISTQTSVMPVAWKPDGIINPGEYAFSSGINQPVYN